ncbi:MAG: DUF1294 domain-containing protein [Clostridia bacterium]|nr:DUF1294 domain-containing protein [Clostridia bacterium]
MKLLITYSAALAVISLITLILYVVDKKRAKKGEWRIPEATLLCFSFFGGAIGGYFAMFAARHKTKHWYFHLVNLLGLLWQIALLVLLLIRVLR